MKERIISVLTAASVLCALAALPVSADDVTVVRLDPSNASPFNGGRFQGWGTSLCWWANRLGYSEKLTSAAADAFFSEGGLSLDIARYNLGGGDDPEHDHITRSDSKIPSYAAGFDDDGNIIYDMTADENQRNIALAAMKANPDIYFEGFSNSPPWFMTNSLCSSGAENAGDDNLNSEHLGDFTEFIAEVTERMRDEYGIKFQSYSPMNEPDTTYWGALSPKQEGAHYSPGKTQSDTITALRRSLDSHGLTDVLVAGMDETDIDKSVANYALLTDEAKAALGRIDTHTYGGSQRRQLKETAVNAGKNLWMSEVDGGWDGFALADRIILDMNGMMPAAWVMWDIVDFHRDSDFTAPDGTKTEADASLDPPSSLWGIAMADHDNETLELSNKYYFFGQFTRYINPGDTIIASSDGTLAAYNKETGDIKIVAVNRGTEDFDYEFDLSAFLNVGNDVTEIRTNNETGDSAEHWKEIKGEAEMSGTTLKTTLKAGTLTTYIIKGADDGFTFDAATGEYSYSDAAAKGSVGAIAALYDENGALKAVKTNASKGKFEESAAGYTAKLLRAADVSYMTVDGSDVVTAGETETYRVNTGETDLNGEIEWSVSDESVAAVDENGMLTARERGDVTVYAHSPSLNHTAEKRVHVTDETEKYDGKSYTLVSSVADATNDFEKDAGKFKLSGGAALTKDGAGNNVLGVQPDYENKDGVEKSGAAYLDLNKLTCADNQTIYIAFDLYASNSGGTADLALYGDNGKETVKLHYLDWDNYEITVGGRLTSEAGAAKIYLRNYVNDKLENQLISNGAHIGIYFTPSTGKIKVTVKNNTNDEETKVYEGTAKDVKTLAGLEFKAAYTTWAKPMYVDNLTTDILEE